METTLRVYDRAGTRRGVLAWSSLNRSVERNGPGAVGATVPASTIPAGLLDDEVYLRVAVDGVEAPEWYLLDDDGDDPTNDAGTARPVAIGGKGVVGLLEWATVYSWEYEPHDAQALADRVAAAQTTVDNAQAALALAQAQLDALTAAGAAQSTIDAAHNVQLLKQSQYEIAAQGLTAALAAQVRGPGNLLGLDPTYPFGEATPGAVLGTLLGKAQQRGCFPHLSWAFTAEHDSAGRAWPNTWSRVYDAGTSLLKVLEQMVGDRWVDYEMAGFELRLFVPDTELAVDRPDLVLRLGQGVTEAPRKRTRSTVRSAILAVGAEGNVVEVTDPDATARYGRREGFEGRSGITDVGTLTAATQVSLARQTSASEALTLAVDPFALPADFPGWPKVGGYIRFDQRRTSPTQLEPLRMQSIAWEYGDSPKISLELADVWVEADLAMARRVDAILNGSTANERVPQPVYADDGVPPATPVGLALVSAPFVDPTNGQLFAQVTAVWVEPTSDADGSAVEELAGYEVAWRQPDVSAGVHTVRTGVVLLATWSPVVADTLLQARIRAFDRAGNYSAWSPWVEVRTGTDETPPPTVTAPVVDNYLGLLRIVWDGEFAGGAARPADLDLVEVHLSAVDGFAPDPRPLADGGTLAGTLFAAGSVFADIPYGQTRYARLVAVDRTGNRAPASPQGSGATGQVVGADIFDGAVGSEKLAYLAVKTANIDLLAVNSAQVGTIEVGKLIAGTMTAEVILGNRIATGQRFLGTPVIELNARGIYRWNAADEQTVAIDDTGVLLVGQYKTAAAGRRIEMGSGGTTGRIDFWSPSGANSFLRAYTEGSGIEAIQFGIELPGTTPLWNRINYNTDGGGYANYRAAKHEFLYRRGGFFHIMEVLNMGNDAAAGVSDPGAERFYIGDGKTSFSYGVGGGNIEFKVGAGGLSPQMVFTSGVGGVAAKIQTFNDGRGDWFELQSWDGSIWIGLRAAAFEVNSDARSKTGIADARLDAVSLVRSARVREYARPQPVPVEQDEHGKATGRPAPGRRRAAGPRREIGLVAQEAPAVIVNGDEGTGMGIDLYRMATVLWGAVQELDGRLAALEGSGTT